jgi:hypothetical protein
MSTAKRTTAVAGMPATAETMTTARDPRNDNGSNKICHSRVKSNIRGIKNIIGSNMVEGRVYFGVIQTINS